MKYSLPKRILAVISACAVMLASGGCAKNDEQDILLYFPGEDFGRSEKILITFFGYKADAMNLTAAENALRGFMSEYRNIDITYEGIKGTAYWDAFDKRDESDVLDDVFMMHHDHVVTMSAEGKLADLSDLPGIENYSERSRKQFTEDDGSVYFLPTSVSTYNLYINYDCLRKHKQKIPENWDEFKSCCNYFVSKGIVPIIANNRNSLTTLIISRGLFDIYQQDNIDDILNEFNKEPSLLADELVPGIEMTAEMLGSGWFDPNEMSETEQTSDDLELFVNGERPFMLSGGWAATRVDSMNPDFEYGVHPYPILDDGCVLSYQVDTCISVNAHSAHLDEAKKFLSYLIKPDVMWEYCDCQASYTPLDDDRLPSEQTLSPSNEYFTNGRTVFRNEYRLELPMEAALSSCADTLLNGGTAAEAKAALLEALMN